MVVQSSMRDPAAVRFVSFSRRENLARGSAGPPAAGTPALACSSRSVLSLIGVDGRCLFLNSGRLGPSARARNAGMERDPNPATTKAAPCLPISEGCASPQPLNATAFPPA